MRKNIEFVIEKNLGVISLILAVLALLSNFLMIYADYAKSIFWVYNVFSYVNLNFMNLDFFRLRGGTFLGKSSFSGNAIHMGFNFIFLIGSVIYLSSKKKEKRVLQFVYAIISFSSCSSILAILILQFTRLTLSTPLGFVFFIYRICLFLFSYLLLKITDKKLNQIIAVNQLSESEQEQYVVTSKGKRFLHLVVDTLVMISLSFSLIRLLPLDLLNSMTSSFGERYAISFLFIITGVIYYVFFEAIFKKTPGKYLTQSFVVGTEEVRVKFEDIFARSFSRKIPFNTFSFLGNTGWHDSLSKTKVLSIKSNKRSAKYLLIVPALGLFFFLNYQFNEFREDYISYKKRNGIVASEANDIQYRLENLEVNDIVSLKRTSNYYSNANYFLKVLKIDGEILTLAKIEKTYKENTIEEIDFLYEFNTEQFETIQVDKDYIRQGICHEYEFSNGYKDCGFKYFEEREEMRVYAINNSFEPVIYFDNVYWNQTDRISMDLESKGKACVLVKIEVLDGDVQINSRLPQKTTQYDKEFDLSITINEKVDHYRLLLLFTDSVDESIEYKYTFTSDGKFEHEFKRLYDAK